MPRGRPRKVIVNEEGVSEFDESESDGELTEKERLLELYETLKSLNIRSISDLENLIAKAE